MGSLPVVVVEEADRLLSTPPTNGVRAFRHTGIGIVEKRSTGDILVSTHG
jgi:hypothetical protein